MPPTRRLSALAAAVLALAAGGVTPAVALAQGAGDEQYQDPFAGGGSASQGSQSSGSQGSGSRGSGTTTTPMGPGTAPTSPGTAATTAPATTASQATTSPTELPRTGLDVRVVAAAGLLLLLGGLVLRRRPGDGRA
jgi:LPXTG-motif cell wall-anchored protein